jgi:hypothetical protein
MKQTETMIRSPADSINANAKYCRSVTDVLNFNASISKKENVILLAQGVHVTAGDDRTCDVTAPGVVVLVVIDRTGAVLRALAVDVVLGVDSVALAVDVALGVDSVALAVDVALGVDAVALAVDVALGVDAVALAVDVALGVDSVALAVDVVLILGTVVLKVTDVKFVAFASDILIVVHIIVVIGAMDMVEFV